MPSEHTAPGDRDRARRSAAWLTVALCLLTLVGAYALKAKCVPQRSGTYPPLCYSDIPTLRSARGLDSGAVPYLDFPEGGSYASRGFLEYPVGTGVVMATTARVGRSAHTYLLVNAVVLALAALACALLLARLVGEDARWWAISPLLFLFAFHNWDLLAVVCVVGGVFAWSRKRPGLAGSLFGLGAAVKLFPFLFLAPLVLERLYARDRRGAARAATAGCAAFALPNLLVAAANRDGWWATYAFHGDRGADIGSIWYRLLPAETSAETVNVLSGALVVLTGVAVLAFGARQAARRGEYPFLPVASALVALVLLWGKVASPQYFLWLLPSLVLLPIGVRWWLAWTGAGVLVYAVSFGVGLGSYDGGDAHRAIEGAALVRAGVLVALTFVFIRAARAAGSPRGPATTTTS